jgi:glycosyltransferase involved in cell wall biosynthesis
MNSILIVSSYWPTEANTISGVFVVQQVEAFVAAGVCCDVLVPTNKLKRANPYLTVADLGLDVSAVRLIEVDEWRLPEKLSTIPGAMRFNTSSYGKSLSKVLKWLRQQRDYDGCIVHGLRYAGLCAGQWSQQLNCKVLLVLHGVDPFIERDSTLPQIKRVVAAAIPHWDKVVLVGSPLKKHAVLLGVPEKLLTVISNGAVLPAATVRSYRGGVTRILSVSHLIPLKGIDLNLRALSRIAKTRPDLNWKYIIVGDGHSRPELEILVNELNLTDRVQFLGRLPYEQTQLEMAEADLFVLPSWNEAFGIVYLEAMGNGVPVIGCLENGAADIITHDHDGLLVPPKSTDELSLAIERLIESPELRAEFGRKGRAKAEEFTWEHNICKILSLFGH